jgi:predicted Zn-dependent peptidase
MSSIYTHRYPNGLTLLVEPMPGVASAAMTLLLPAGVAYEPSGKLGVAPILTEMINRGAGDLGAKAHSDALDLLGVHRSAETQTYHLRLGATFLGSRIDPVLPLMFDMVRRPALDAAALEPSIALALQSLESLEDNPQEKVMIELKRRHLGEPLGRSVMGEAADLETLTLEDVRNYAAQRFLPDGAILGFAGDVNINQVRNLVDALLGDWTGGATRPDFKAHAMPGYSHVTAQTTQQHIGIAYPAVSAVDRPDTVLQRIATAVLSGGMSGRLFTEVRENRGLCYSVYATYVPQRASGSIYCYAGTTTQRAAETLEVLTGELLKLGAGVDADEFQRAVVGLKARLVMQGESTTARASAIAYDQFLLGQPRSLDDVAAEIDAVTLPQLNAFVAGHKPRDFTTLTIGPEPLTPATGN